MKLVYIEWLDASSSLGWHYLDKEGTSLICSTGWLINKTKKTVTISSSYNDSGKFLDQLHIPACVIKKYRVLKEYPA